MSRRALPKIDPELDLSGHLWTLDTLPLPWDSVRVFGRTAPLEIEVGSGKGLFLSGAAGAQPERNFLGIEIARKYAVAVGARLVRRELSNAASVNGDGLRLFREWLPSDAVSAVHVYFPDPWWKKRHRKRRVMNDAFVADIHRVLIPGGSLHFWTDVEEYFQATLELIRGASPLAGPVAVPAREPQHDLDYRTHFERRMRLAGEAVYRAEFHKLADRETAPSQS